MNIASFDDLLVAARQQPEPQRLLFVFAGVELPDDATEAQRARFEQGQGGALVPRMCVDKTPQELPSFAALVAEAQQFTAPGHDWVMVFAAAYANGGSVDNVQPGTDYLGKLHAAGNVLRVEGTTPYAKFLKGEIPVWISYENDGLKATHVDGMGDAVEVVIPKEASVAAPYAISLVKNGPNPNAGKLWLNFIMSEAGQTLFAQGFERRLTRGGLEHDLEAELVGQQLAKAGPHDLMVVDDGDAQHGRRSGTRCRGASIAEAGRRGRRRLRRGAWAHRPLTRLMTKLAIAITRNTTNSTLAMPAAPAAMPLKPSTAAMRAMTKKTTA